MLVTTHNVDFRLSLLLTFPNQCYWGLFDTSPKSILPEFLFLAHMLKQRVSIVLSYWSENLSMTILQKLILISKYTLEYTEPNKQID